MAEPDTAAVEINPHAKDAGVEIKLEDFFTKVLSTIGKVTDKQVAELLKKSNQTIAVAESLTGGLISAHLSALPGSSEYFIGSIVCYHTRIKVTEVGVPAASINQHGAASKETALAMAEGIRRKFKTDIGLSATGSAGPLAQAPAPPGRVFVALASSTGAEWKEFNLQGTRTEIREKSAQAALGLLWLHLGGSEIL
ncbi:MAG: CinA family protein [Candidatus Margulisbacteria bacterium]|nr:CinA family protein [Candidatus Margulisiibacteriota bacterium]